MAAKIKILKEKYHFTDEMLKEIGVKSPMLSGRILEEEKEELLELCKNSTQSEIIRKKLNELIKTKNIDWQKVKILKGESIKGRKTMSVRVKVDEKTEQKVKELCDRNNVTRSSFIRYVVKKCLEEEDEK